jgi:hypothetical protein
VAVAKALKDVDEDDEEEDTWAKAVEEEIAHRSQIELANESLLHGVAMSRQGNGAATTLVMQESLGAGKTLVTQTDVRGRGSVSVSVSVCGVVVVG